MSVDCDPKTEAVIGCTLSILLCDQLPRIATDLTENLNQIGSSPLHISTTLFKRGKVTCCVGRAALSFKRNPASKRSYICTEDTGHLSEHLLCAVTRGFKVQLKNASRLLDIHLVLTYIKE